MYNSVTNRQILLSYSLLNYTYDFVYVCRYRLLLYISWSELMVLGMLFLIPLWYNYFIANSVMLVFFCAIAAFNGATYYVDVFSFEGSEKTKSSKSDVSSLASSKEQPPGDSNNLKPSQTVVLCTPDGDMVETKVSV